MESTVAATATLPMSDARRSLVARAKGGDTGALLTMLTPFIADNETVVDARYLGVDGMWGLGISSFGVVTDRRLATIRVHPFGSIEYQDGELQHLNSGVVWQPSRLGLYALIVGLAVLTFGISLLFTPLVARGYHRFRKSGMLLSVREGVHVWMFCDRSRFRDAAHLYRSIALVRQNGHAPATPFITAEAIQHEDTSAPGDRDFLEQPRSEFRGLRLAVWQYLAIGLGGTLAIVGTFIPVVRLPTGDDFSMWSFPDVVGLAPLRFVTLQPMVVLALGAAAFLAVSAVRGVSSRLAAVVGALAISTGVSCIAWLLFGINFDQLAPAIGVGVGVLGATLAAVACLVACVKSTSG